MILVQIFLKSRLEEVSTVKERTASEGRHREGPKSGGGLKGIKIWEHTKVGVFNTDCATPVGFCIVPVVWLCSFLA